jgi:putative hydrolase of the HAD superfamily
MRFYRSWRPVEALSFDLDDTLYENGSVIQRAEDWLADQLKNTIVETAHLNHYHWLRYKQRVLRERPELGHDVSACRLAWLELALHECGSKNAKARSCELLDGFIAVRSDLQVPPESFALLDRLAARYPLIAITNGNVDTTRIGLAPYFTQVLKPIDGVRCKPHADLFKQAQLVLDVAPDAIAHIGDHPVTDVAGALACGYRAIWLNRAGRDRRLRNLPHVELSSLQELDQLL